jgi:UDP-N-acetylmuramate dehydrogenase
MWWRHKSQNETLEFLKKEFSDIVSDLPLAKISYIKIGGNARYYLEVHTKNDLIKAVKLAREAKISHLVVGATSNLLFSDQGFNGLIIKNNYASKDAISVNSTEVIAPTGINLLVLVKELAQKGLGGIEFLAPIPGTLGGAVVNNAGANGKEMKEILIGANVLDFNGEVKFISTDKLGLNYRSSKLKGLAKKRQYLKYPVILEAKIKLISRSKEEVDRLVQSLVLRRAKSQVKGLNLGCVFKNPKMTQQCHPEDAGRHEGSGPIDKYHFPDKAINLNRVSCGYLLEQLNLKNKKCGRIQISPVHANIFVNLGGGKARDFQKLIAEAKIKVKEKFDLDLQEEIEIVENFKDNN